MSQPSPPLQQGLLQNLRQLSLLVLINAFVGAMIGMERAILPALASEGFGLEAHGAILSFIAVFGLSKALTNYVAGRWADTFGRRPLLIFGWVIAAAVPWLLIWAPSWAWVLIANALLGISQGLTWSTTVIMKIDLAGPKQRGLAMGLNEFAGYLAVALAALATSYIAAQTALRPQPFYLGASVATLGLLLSAFFARETKPFAALEAKAHSAAPPNARLSFWHISLKDPTLSSISQAGMINNLNDGMAWGLFPLIFASAGLTLKQAGWLVALYPAVWGLGQLFTGALSDRLGRKRFIVLGMMVQAAGIALIAAGSQLPHFATGAALLGLGTAAVYPTLLAAIGDVVHPQQRAHAVGVYRLWRDLGYVLGALIAGLMADMLGLTSAALVVAAITFTSGLLVALRMREPLPKRSTPQPANALTTA